MSNAEKIEENNEVPKEDANEEVQGYDENDEEVEDALDAEEEKERQLAAIFGSIEKRGGNPPSRETYDEWKRLHEGKVYISVLSDTEIFFFRPILWGEYRSIKKSAMSSEDPQAFMDEMFIERALLWPKIEAIHSAAQLAGTIPTLSTQIQRASNFMTEAEAFSIVIN